MSRKPPGKFITGQDGDRREFFRETLGQIAGKVAERAEKRVAPVKHVRPPGALDEIEFLSTCTRCNICVDVCPVNAIVKAPGSSGLAVGSPILRLGIQACVVCDDMPCALSCTPNALVAPPGLWSEFRFGTLVLDSDRCITFDGVSCGVCVPVCPVGETAIALDEGGHPIIKKEGCVGCGVCVNACVTSPSSLKILQEDR